jgi:hypothetical protein
MLLKTRKRLEMPMKKKGFICFEMLKEGWKFEKLFMKLTKLLELNRETQYDFRVLLVFETIDLSCF